MEYFYLLTPFIGIVLRTFIIEYYKNNRFKNFKKIYENEKFEKLSDYEEKSKSNNIIKIPKRSINDS